VATLLLAAVSVGILQGFTLGFRAARTGANRVAALAAAREKIETIKGIEYGVLEKGSAWYTASYPYLVAAYSDLTGTTRPLISSGRSAGAADDVYGQTYVQIQEIATGLSRATVTVVWGEGDRDQNVVLKTFVSRY